MSTNTTNVYISDDHVVEFWARVRRTEDCWIWEGHAMSTGGMFSVSGKKFAAHRVAWVIDHEESLASWYKVQRTCQMSICVRPSHLKVIRGLKPKRKSGKRKTAMYILRRGNERTELPPRKRFTFADFKEYVYDLKGVLSELTALRQQIAQFEKNSAQVARNIEEIGRRLPENFASAIDPRLNTLEFSVDSLRQKVDNYQIDILKLSEIVEESTNIPPFFGLKEGDDPIDKTAVVNFSEAVSIRKVDPEDPLLTPDAAHDGADLADLLMRAFQGEMGGPSNPTSDDHEALATAFELALSEAPATKDAVQIFALWLGRFRKLTAENDAMERSPAQFARQVADRVIV